MGKKTTANRKSKLASATSLLHAGDQLLGPPSTSRFYSAFISASASDLRFALMLSDRLRDAGVLIWLAREALEPSGSTEAQIEQALRTYDRILFVVSEAIIDSRWMRFEAQLALRRELGLQTPVLIPLVLVSQRRWVSFGIRPGALGTVPGVSKGDWDFWSSLINRPSIDFSRWDDEEAFRNSFRALLDWLQLPQTPPPPSGLIEVVGSVSAELIERIKQYPQLLHKIGTRTFEELVAELLAQYGWQVHLTPPSKDGGFDILAVSKELAGTRTSWIIQCKKQAPDSPVGIEIADALYGVKGRLGGLAANAMIATTSRFTKGVKDLKATRFDFDTRDFHNIIEWVNEYRPNPAGRLYIRDNQLVVPKIEIAVR